jgi:hypothetical protein
MRIARDVGTKTDVRPHQVNQAGYQQANFHFCLWLFLSLRRRDAKATQRKAASPRVQIHHPGRVAMDC